MSSTSSDFRTDFSYWHLLVQASILAVEVVLVLLCDAAAVLLLWSFASVLLLKGSSNFENVPFGMDTETREGCLIGACRGVDC